MSFEIIQESTPFWHFHKNVNVAQLGHVPSIGTSDNRKGQCLVNTAGEVALPI